MLAQEVAAVLERALKLGAWPMVRRRLYARLQRICVQRGDAAVQIVSQVLVEARGGKIRDPGQYFCFVVTRRLKEEGLWDPPAADAVQVQVALAAVTEAIDRVAVPEVQRAQLFIDEAIERKRREHQEDIYRRLREQAAREEAGR